MDDDALRKAKLTKLLEIEGYESVENLIEAVFSDSVSPAICMNEDCTFTCEMGGGHLPQSQHPSEGHTLIKDGAFTLMTRQRLGARLYVQSKGVPPCWARLRSRSPPLFSALHQFQLMP